MNEEWSLEGKEGKKGRKEINLKESQEVRQGGVESPTHHGMRGVPKRGAIEVR